MHITSQKRIAMWFRLLVVIGLVSLVAGQSSQSGELSGNAAFESRLFAQEGTQPEQHKGYLSFAFEPEYYFSLDDGRQSILMAPFFRLDQYDKERTHYDIREFYWQYVSDAWELKVGLARVFWGVTESVHMVDIINQTDFVESPDSEDKLGQPMVNLTLIRNWGTIDLFLLPVFRERTFSGREGRLRSPQVIDTDHAEYESDAEQYHGDWAVRWSHSIGDYDIGVAHFRGTNRDPDLRRRTNSDSDIEFVPYYEQIDQTSLDFQATKGSWLWKLEAISRGRNVGRFTAFAGGFEYALSGAFGSGYDLGILAEYLFDDRGDKAPISFEDDLFLGARLALNDVQSTSLLAGAVVDRVSSSSAVFIEADRRIGDSWKLEIEMRSFIGVEQSDPMYTLRDDDFLQITVSRFF